MADDFVKYLRRKSEMGPDAEGEEDSGSSSDTPFGEYKGSEYIIQARDKDFHDIVKKNKVALVFFYASWCGHCKVVKPVLSEVAMELHTEGSKAKIVVIDASENGKVGNEFGIKGFPTIKLFVDGKVSEEFKLARTKEAFLKFIRTAGGAAKEEL